MASTNKTTHYELSQYVGSDKPTYLTDYNNDMSAIDTGIYNAQDKADSAYTLANTADGKADTGIANAGLAQTDASTALTRIGTLANLTTTEKTNLVGAINEVDADIKKFDFTSFTTYAPSDLTNGTDGTIVSSTLTLAKNSDSSIIKLYGSVVISNPGTNGAYVRIPGTSVRPSEKITVNNLGIRIGFTATDFSDLYETRAEFNTNGDIDVFIIPGANITTTRAILFPCVIFMKNFGDTPSN